MIPAMSSWQSWT